MNKQIKPTGLLFFLIFFIFSCNENSGNASSKEKGKATEIAVANGLKEFSDIKSLAFTFNVDRDSSHMERRWKWMPAENSVIFYGTNDSTVFKRMDTSTAELRKLNEQFTNDEYWLTFPMHLHWDMGYTFSESDTATGPVTGKKYQKYTVQYNNKDGFTPGDMYELYTDDKYTIHEWSFHKTGAKDPSLMTSWEDYEDFDGLKIAKEHKTKDGKFRLYFTGISVVR